MPILGRAGIGPVAPTSTMVAARPSFTQLLVQPTWKYVPAPAGGSGDDQTMLAAFLGSLNAGDTMVWPAGLVYRHSGKLELASAAKAGITILGNNATLLATTPAAAAFLVRDGADDVNIFGLTHQVSGATTRINLANDVAPFVFNNVRLGQLADLQSIGSAGLGFYFWKATGVGQNLERLVSSGSLADGIHFTNGSGGFSATDCQSLDAGDDGFAHIGYLQDGAEAGRPQSIVLIRPKVRDSRARGISYAGARDCSAFDVDIDGTLAANIYFAVERGDFNTSATDRCSVTRGRLARAGTSYAAIPNGTNGTGLDQGAVLFLSSGTGATVTDCTAADLNIGQLAAVNYDTIRAIVYNGGTITRCAVTGAQLYAGSPSTFVGGNTPASISPQSSTNRRTETLPAYSSGGGGSSSGRPAMTVSPIIALDADTLGAVGSSVASWVDAVSARAFEQATASLQPVVATGPNGHKAVQFTSDHLASTDNAAATRASFTVAMLIRVDGLTGTIPRQGLISGLTSDAANDYEAPSWSLTHPAATSDAAFQSLVAGGGVTGTNDVNIKPSSQPFGQWVIVVAQLGRDGAAGQIYTNGTAETSTAPASTGAALSLARMYLGARRYGGAVQDQSSRFSLFRLHVFPGRLSTADRSTLDSDWSDASGVTVADYVAAGPVVGTADLTGSGTLSAGASPATGGGASLSGSGSLISAGTPMASAAAALSGSGGLAAAGTPAAVGPAALTGSGSLTSTGTPSLSAPAALSGAGTLTATPTPSTSGAGSLSGTGTLAASGAPAQSAPAALSGTGTLTGTGAAKTSGQGALAGSGQLSGSGSGAENGTSTASLSGAGQLAASGSPAGRSTGALAGTGTLAATGRPTAGQSAALGGSGQLTATGSGTERATGTAALSGAGQLTTTATPATSAAGALTGTGQLAATGQLGDRPPYTLHLYVDAAVLPAVHAADLTVDGVSASTLTEATSLATLQT